MGGYDPKAIAKNANEMLRTFTNIMYKKQAAEREGIRLEVQAKRKEETWRKRKEYMSPMDRVFARKYFSENQDEVGEFAGMPGAMGQIAQKSQKEDVPFGTGMERRKTSHPGVEAPTTFKPGSQEKTMEMTDKGFSPMSVEDRPFDQLLRKAEENPGRLSVKEKKLLGVEKEEKFVQAIRDVEAGKQNIKSVAKKFPEKSKAIKDYKTSKMNFKSQTIMKQIEDQISGFNVEEGDTLVIEELNAHIEDIISQLFDERKEAEAQGIDVGGILDALNIDEAQWQKALEARDSSGSEEEKKSNMDKIKGFVGKAWEVLRG